VQGCCPFLLMVYSGSPVETSVGHGVHQQLFSRKVSQSKRPYLARLGFSLLITAVAVVDVSIFNSKKL